MVFIGRFKDFLFLGLVLLAFTFAFVGGKYFSPIETNFTDLASDAIKDAVSTFTAPLKDATDNLETQSYNSSYNVSRSFWLPGLMYLLATIFSVFAVIIYTKFNEWKSLSNLDKLIKLAMIFVVCFMGFLFCISGFKYLLYGLFHALMFGVAFIILIIMALSILRVVAQPNRS
ncbi:hypothetical protein ACFSFW_19335 [Fredinandcohnia salidurans]|uniref:Uncharacterized protein n=1 Tax=Fredinandcohnia salidurans TaxID=2595041 RepID=A0ABW4MSG5_9BACI